MWETLHQYLEKQCDTIANLLPEIGKKAGRKEVHRLRVSIKRARACITFAGDISGDAIKGGRYVKLLKVLHQGVGATRDLDLQYQHLRHYTGEHPQQYNVLYLLLINHQRLAQQQAQAIAAAFPARFIKALPEQLRKKQLNHARLSSSKQLSAYLQEQYAAIAGPVGHVPAEQWHDVRKDIKRLYYNLEMMQPELDDSPSLKKMIAFTDNAGSRLGSWHDLIAFRQFMRNSISLMRSRDVAIPDNAPGLFKQIDTDIRNRLQECRQLLLQKPELSIR
jgi:CHAD domain-containing protein